MTSVCGLNLVKEGSGGGMASLGIGEHKDRGPLSLSPGGHPGKLTWPAQVPVHPLPHVGLGGLWPRGSVPLHAVLGYTRVDTECHSLRLRTCGRGLPWLAPRVVTVSEKVGSTEHSTVILCELLRANQASFIRGTDLGKARDQRNMEGSHQLLEFSLQARPQQFLPTGENFFLAECSRPCPWAPGPQDLWVRGDP